MARNVRSKSKKFRTRSVPTDKAKATTYILNSKIDELDVHAERLGASRAQLIEWGIDLVLWECKHGQAKERK